MQLVNLKCPSCGGDIERDGDKYFCKSCGAAFAVNYDEADVEHEKLQNYDEISRIEHEHEKEMEELRFKQNEKSRRAAERRESVRKAGREFRAKIYGLIFLIIFFSIGPLCWWFMAKQGLMPSFQDIIAESQASYKDVYAISMDNFTDDVIDNMIDAAIQKKKKDRDGRSISEYKDGEWTEYNLSEAEYDGAYLITGATEGKNRVVVFLKLKYTSDAGEKETYDAFYFDELKLSENDTIVSDYAPESIYRSDLAWKNDSFDSREQCYRENVLAFGGTVTEIKK